MNAFKTYVCLTVSGLILRMCWDLNHYYEWIKDGDMFFGVGFALVFIGGAIYIDSTKSKGWSKVFTRFALFTAISNLCDEVLFDPYTPSWEEWATSVFVLISLHIYNIVKKSK